MRFLLPAVFLFGLVHPGARWILDTGVTLLPFCAFYIGIRLLIQLPLVLRNRITPFETSSSFFYLIALGLVGAALQISEFVGISKGLPVSVVTFLVYTHPIWTLILSGAINKEPISAANIAKVSLAIAGVLLIALPRFGPESVQPLLLIAPLAAGIFVSLWVCLSNKAQKNGCSTQAVSFYYDLFAFLSLCCLLANSPFEEIRASFEWISNAKNLILMTTYSVLIGLLPNYLFYYGSKKTTALTSGLLLLLEPVISTIVSRSLWGDHLSPSFVAGAIFMLCAAIPNSILKRLQLSVSVILGRGESPKSAFKILIYFVFLNAFFVDSLSAVENIKGTLTAIEVVPSSTSDYTVSAELKQLNEGIDVGIEAYKKFDSKCRFDVQKAIGIGTEDKLFSTVKSASTNPGINLVIGFSRSNFARVAAKAALGTTLFGISTGAATTQLHEINPNFVSIASPWTRQWEAIQKHMIKTKCEPDSTVGIFDSKDHISNKFRSAFSQSGFPGVVEDNDNVLRLIESFGNSKKCIFVGMSFSRSQKILSSLISSGWVGSLYGVGDWNIYSDELRKLLASHQKAGRTIRAPTGWHSSINEESKKFAARIYKGLRVETSPIGAYAYDSTLIALAAICEKTSPSLLSVAQMKKLPLLRKYDGVSSSGNFLSDMQLIEFKTGK